MRIGLILCSEQDGAVARYTLKRLAKIADLDSLNSSCSEFLIALMDLLCGGQNVSPPRFVLMVLNSRAASQGK